MNKNRRASIRIALDYLEKAIDLIRIAKDEEEDALSNMPDNLQNSEKYDAIENAIDNLEDAVVNIDEAKNCIYKAIE